MPAVRNTRSSGRLSDCPPTEPKLDIFQDDSLTLLYPEDGSSTIFHACATPSSTCSTSPRSDSELSLPSSPSTDGAGDASFTPLLSHASRKKNDGHIPRPPNAFMMFRSFLWDQMKHDPQGPRDHREISKSAGREWRLLSKQQRKPYEEKAKAKKAEHEKMYPGYRYAPVSKLEVKKRRMIRDTRAEAERCRDAVDMLMRRKAKAVSKASRTETKIPETLVVSVPDESLYRKTVTRSPPCPTPPARPRRQSQSSSSTSRAHVEVRVERREDLGMYIVPMKLEHEPELVAPCSTSDVLATDDWVPMSEIPHLDLSDSISGLEETELSLLAAESALDASSLFSNLLSSLLAVKTDAISPVEQRASSISLSGQGSGYSQRYSDSGSDATESPTSGLLSSSPTWSFETNNWTLADFDSQFSSYF